MFKFIIGFILLFAFVQFIITEKVDFDQEITIKNGVKRSLEYFLPNVNEKLTVEVIPKGDFKCKVKFNGFTTPTNATYSFPQELKKAYFLFDWIVDEVKEYNAVFRYAYDKNRVRSRGFEEDTMRFSMERIENSYQLFTSDHSGSTRTKSVSQGGSDRDFAFKITKFMIVGKDEEFLTYGDTMSVVPEKQKIITITSDNNNRVGLKLFAMCNKFGQIGLTKEEQLIPGSNKPSGTIDLDGWIGFRVNTTNGMSCEIKHEYDIKEAGRVTKINQILSDNTGKSIKAMVWRSNTYEFIQTKREGDIVVYTQNTLPSSDLSYVFIVAHGADIQPKPKDSSPGDSSDNDGNTNGASNDSCGRNVTPQSIVLMFIVIVSTLFV